MTAHEEHDKLVALRTLIEAADADKRVRNNQWGEVDQDDPYYMIPTGVWSDIVRVAK